MQRLEIIFHGALPSTSLASTNDGHVVIARLLPSDSLGIEHLKIASCHVRDGLLYKCMDAFKAQSSPSDLLTYAAHLAAWDAELRERSTSSIIHSYQHVLSKISVDNAAASFLQVCFDGSIKMSDLHFHILGSASPADVTLLDHVDLSEMAREGMFATGNDSSGVCKVHLVVFSSSFRNELHTEAQTATNANAVTESEEEDREPVLLGCSIIGTRQLHDRYKRPYTAYNFEITQGTVKWTIEKRFSDFDRLHIALLSKSKDNPDFIPPSSMPSLPSKFSNDVTLRTITLTEYLEALLAFSSTNPNREVLRFIGLLVDVAPSGDYSKESSRPNISLMQLESECDTGDLILFRCNNPYSQLQRTLTGAEWDHIGVVVRVSRRSYLACRHQNKQHSVGKVKPLVKWEVVERDRNATAVPSMLCLVECTGDGVTCLPLYDRIRAYDYYKCVDYMALRRLDIADSQARSKAVPIPDPIDDVAESRRRLAWSSNVSSFLNLTVGAGYEFKVSNLIFSMLTPSVATENTSKLEIDLSAADGVALSTTTASSDKPLAFFCTELVAAGLKAMGVLKIDVRDDYFWPGTFASSGELSKFVVGSHFYGSEMTIHCVISSVSSLVPAGGSDAASIAKPRVAVPSQRLDKVNSHRGSYTALAIGEESPSSISAAVSLDNVVLEDEDGNCDENIDNVANMAPAATFVPTV